MSQLKQRVLMWFSGNEGHEAYALDIMEDTGLSSAALYPVLRKLEMSGLVTSRWGEGAYPRRRLYRLATSNQGETSNV